LTDQAAESHVNRWATREVHYLCRWWTPALALLAIALMAGPVLWFAWYISVYPDWMPEAPDFGHRRLKRGVIYTVIFWAFFILFMKLPIWIRLPFLLAAGLHLARLSLRKVPYAFDQKPDFSIGPEGIGGLDKTGFHIIPWPDVKSVTVRGPNVEIVGQEHGPRRFFDTLPPRRLRIGFSQLIFDLRREDVIEAVRFFRPDLEIHVIKNKYWG
jgi:hypothetical protein